MPRKLTLFVLAASLFTLPLYAQISFGGKPYGDKAEKIGMPPAVVVELPVPNVDSLKADDERRAALGIPGPYRFGFEHVTSFTLGNSGSWYNMPNGDRVWRLELHCPGALSINLQFDRYVIPEGARMFIYDPAGTVKGGFTAKSNPGHKAFGTAPLAGDRQTVEYIEPASVAGQGELAISMVVHGYRPTGLKEQLDFGDSGPCNVNTICPAGDEWRPEIRSVARIMLGGGLCTGSLINNCANDSTPYFLTANHCTEGNTSNASWVFLFNWESPTCDPSENAPQDHTITGCDKLFEYPQTDASFLRLSSIPPDEFEPYWSGWDISGTAPDTVVGIHHPRGDIKKICHSYGPIVEGMMSGADCWQVTAWHVGTTEQGSSGSAIWNQDHRIIGQLFGGQASCNNNVNDFYGRFNLTYPHLTEWLGECGDVLDGLDPSAIVPVPLDAAVTSIAGVPHITCNSDSIRPAITLKNNGEGPIHSVNIHYSVNGSPVGIMPWNGMLQPVQTTNVTLPAIYLPSGVHELRVAASSPNQDIDTNPLNDADSLRFIVNAPGIPVEVRLNLDRYGSETTWKIETQDGFPVHSGGPYSNSANGYAVTQEVCLTNDCYVFTIMDAVGDGMCCNYGQGSFNVSDTTGAVLLNGNGNFGFSSTTVFCVNWVGINETAANHGQLLIAPNPSNGRLTAQLPQGMGQVQLLVQDALGRQVYTQRLPPGIDHVALDLGHLARGTYIVVAIGEGQKAVQRVVIQP